VIEHFRELYRDPVCSGHLDVLLDVSQADTLPEPGQLGPINAELGAIRDKVRFGLCAIVATRDAMFGMMRMFEVLARPRASSDPEAWLVSQRTAGSRHSDPPPEGLL
jgi:hypothetical protein